MRCPACAAEWPIDKGVPIYDSAKYFGETDRTRMERLVAVAEREGWQTAARRAFETSNLGLYSYVADLNRANWTSLLPLGTDSTVLDVGSGLGAVTHALALTYSQVVSIEPIAERVRFTRLRVEQEALANVELVQTTLTSLPFFDNTFDLIVLNGILEWIGEWTTDAPPREAQLAALQMLKRKLKSGGILLVGIENRIAWESFLGTIDHSGLRFTNLMPRGLASLYVRLRTPHFYRTLIDHTRGYRTYTYSQRGYRKLLREAGFDWQEFWWPTDGYNLPLTMFRIGDRRTLLEEFRRERNHRQRMHGFSFRRVLKDWLLVRSGLIHLTLPSFVILAADQCRDRNRNRRDDCPILKALEPPVTDHAGRADSSGRTGALLINSLRSHGSRNKQVLEIVDSAAQTTVLAKLANVRRESHERIDRGFRNLQWIHGVLASGGTIAARSVPDPLGLARTGNTIVAVESRAPGLRLHDLVMEPGYFRNRRRVRGHLELLARWLIDFQRQVSKMSLQELSEIPSAWRAKNGRLLGGSVADNESARLVSWVQHGDLFTANVFLDEMSKTVFVIDWDDLASGYPPLFDFFCLVTSFVYTQEQSPLGRGETIEPLSLRQTYLERNWFSDIVRETARAICDALDLRHADLDAYLDEYVTVRRRQFLEGPGYGATGAQRALYEHFSRLVRAESTRSIFRNAKWAGTPVKRPTV